MVQEDGAQALWKGKSYGGVVLVNMAVQTQVEVSPSTRKLPSDTEVESKKTHLPSNANSGTNRIDKISTYTNHGEGTCFSVAADSV